MKNFLTLCLLLSPLSLCAQLSEQGYDDLVQQTLKTFDVPGIAVGVVKDGRVVHAKGYGLRSLNNKLPVDEHTLFGIASNSKAFTGVALAILNDEGKINWEDKVTKYIPEFALNDEYTTRNFTIKDLLTHRGGLGLGAGDLMFFPEGGNHTVASIIEGMRYLPTESSFRNELKYNNNFFIIAGEVIKRVSGQSWEDFITEKIMKPVGMTESYASFKLTPAHANRIDAHAPWAGKVAAVPHDWNDIANPAGGIMSNIVDLSKWATVVMNDFVLPNGKRLVSKAQQQKLWNIHMPTGVALGGPYNTHFNGYGLGWFLSDVKGHFQVAHTGGLIGTVTQFIVLPDIDLGIIVLTNQQQGAAFTAISNTIKDSYLGYPDRNWVKTYGDRYQSMNKFFDKERDSVFALVKKAKWSAADEQKIMGSYHDKWMGDVHITKAGQKLRLQFERSPRLKGSLYKIKDHQWVVQWDERYYDADAYLYFENNGAAASSFTMKAVSDVTDFSFDFHDLKLLRK